MRLPDTNVLLYAYNRAAEQHQVANQWVTHRLSGTEPIGFAWVALLGFLRISTHRAAVPAPLEPRQALDLMDRWLAQPNAVVVQSTERHAAILRELIQAAGAAGKLTTDAHLAALAIEHGATLASFDADFHRFDELKFEYLR